MSYMKCWGVYTKTISLTRVFSSSRGKNKNLTREKYKLRLKGIKSTV